MKARRRAAACLLAAAWLLSCRAALADPPQSRTPDSDPVSRICDLIGSQAERNGLPKDFLARLIWKESRFDAGAVSPAGAEGIAQFMPGTAAMRKLADSFDIAQAIPAAALYLADLKARYGNLGLAAAAYNAGESRVSRWLSSGGLLPIETESYVLEIMGEPVDVFTNTAHAGTVEPLDAKAGFAAACRSLPVTGAGVMAMASISVKPWGVQVAGNFRRSAAVNQWLRVRGRFPALLAAYEPVVSRVRTPIGRRGVYAVRIGLDDRAGADAICRKLRGAGGSCIVARNR